MLREEAEGNGGEVALAKLTAHSETQTPGKHRQEPGDRVHDRTRGPETGELEEMAEAGQQACEWGIRRRAEPSRAGRVFSGSRCPSRCVYSVTLFQRERLSSIVKYFF